MLIEEWNDTTGTAQLPHRSAPQPFAHPHGKRYSGQLSRLGKPLLFAWSQPKQHACALHASHRLVRSPTEVFANRHGVELYIQ
jgi:hypothetical protein